MTDANDKVHAKLIAIYDSLFRHNGFGEMTVEVRILKKQQKEVIIKCGKQFRFVVDWKNTPCPATALSATTVTMTRTFPTRPPANSLRCRNHNVGAPFARRVPSNFTLLNV
jgi:hypothetical protein